MTTVNNRRFKLARGARRINAQVQFAAFSAVAAAWPGASYAITTLPANPGFNYAFTLPITPAATTFVPVIRFNNGATYYRYKLWSTGTEMVPFELYAGQKIVSSYNPVLEIWTVQGSLAPAMSAPWNLSIGFVTDPGSIADNSPIVYPLY